MQNKPMNILGIETSCDETAAAVVTDGQTIKSSVVASKAKMHEKYGGCRPRNHLTSPHREHLPSYIRGLDIEKIRQQAGIKEQSAGAEGKINR
jgi:N6-L-threonylcarbamoyladenine synthase